MIKITKMKLNAYKCDLVKYLSKLNKYIENKEEVRYNECNHFFESSISNIDLYQKEERRNQIEEFRKMKNVFFVASPNSVVPATKVKILIDYETSVAKKILSCQPQENIRCLNGSNQKRRTVIWMDYNIFYVTSVNIETIYNRIVECGVELVNVGRGYYVSVDHIDCVLGFNTSLAARVRKETEMQNTKFSFVRKTKKRNSTILLNTGESISVSNDPENLLKKLHKGVSFDI